MQDNIDKDKELYVIAVLRYKEEHPELDDLNLFSIDWNLCKDYRLKNIIIATALKEHKRVEETELYQSEIVENAKQL